MQIPAEDIIICFRLQLGGRRASLRKCVIRGNEWYENKPKYKNTKYWILSNDINQSRFSQDRVGEMIVLFWLSNFYQSSTAPPSTRHQISRLTTSRSSVLTPLGKTSTCWPSSVLAWRACSNLSSLFSAWVVSQEFPEFSNPFLSIKVSKLFNISQTRKCHLCVSPDSEGAEQLLQPPASRPLPVWPPLPVHNDVGGPEKSRLRKFGSHNHLFFFPLSS